jgi:hypothetical protein
VGGGLYRVQSERQPVAEGFCGDQFDTPCFVGQRRTNNLSYQFQRDFQRYYLHQFPGDVHRGIPSNLKKLTHGQPFLVGCTEDVLINGDWVLPQVENDASVTYQNVEVTCQRQPQCSPNPCHSGGHCTDLWLDFRCTCGRPYLGHTCQYSKSRCDGGTCLKRAPL